MSSRRCEVGGAGALIADSVINHDPDPPIDAAVMTFQTCDHEP
jgi:hypothetical protein